MISTLGGRIALTLGALLLLVLVLAALLVYSGWQADAHLRRSQVADAQLAAYLQLALEARRPDGSLGPALTRLDELIRRERTLTLDEEDAAREQFEQQRLDTLRNLIRQADGQPLLPAFWTHIDAALADERAEVEQVARRGRELARRLNLIASAAAAAALVLAVLIGALLLRSIQRPVAVLLAGTERLAAGELEHRIRIAAPRELARLGEAFNRMGGRLQSQRQDLLAARDGLEDKVARRTRELRRANRELRRLDRVRRQFFADISHELRTPLTAIRGEAEVTLRGPDKPPADYRSALARIGDLSRQMGHLVDDLLLLARSDTLQTRAQVRTLALDELLEAVCRRATALARHRELEMTLALSDRRVAVRGDPQRLEQLLLGLIDNACRYTPPGGEVMLSLERDGGEAVIAVADTGIGIETDELEQVFRRHFRGRRARELAPRGSGLGLTLARAAALAHHGTLILTSTPGVGTTVTVRLPLSDQEVMPHATAAG